jgi:hypothetical protein
MGIHSSVACNWQTLLGQAGGTNGSAVGTPSSYNFATLTSSAGDLGEFYWGYVTTASGLSEAGTTSGFTYSVDGNGDMEMYNLSLAGSTGYTPNGRDTVASLYDTVAFIVQAIAKPLPTPVFARQSVKRASFY